MTAFDQAWALLKSMACDGCAELFDDNQINRISIGGESGQGWAHLCPDCMKTEMEWRDTPNEPLNRPSGRDIDNELNDDEFIDQESFNDPVPDIVSQIMATIGAPDDGLLECYSCGLEGDLRTFFNPDAIPMARETRKCPNCGSYEVHGKDAYQGR